MPKIDPKAIVLSAARYLRQHPGVARMVAVNAVSMKVTVPLDLLRYLVEQTKGKKNAPKDVVFEAQEPALRAAASVNAMGTPLRVGASVKIEKVSISTEEIRIELEVNDVLMRVEDDSESPIAALLKSGALDLSNPGNLAHYMPNRPPMLVEAKGKKIVLDLMKDVKIAQNPKVKRMLELITPVLGIRSVKTDEDAIVISLQPKPSGVPKVIETVRHRMGTALVRRGRHDSTDHPGDHPMIRGLQTKTLVRLRDHLLDTGQRKSMFVAGAEAYEHPLEGDDEAKAFFDAVAEAMFLMIASDGKIEQAEKEVFRGALKELTGGAMRTAAIEKLTEELATVLGAEGQAKRLDAVCAVLKERTEAAEAGFVLAAAIAFADDEIADAENDVLNDLAERLGISEERAGELLDELEQDGA